jgi:hypothetical protein|tara:strand:- start:368 stop:490 length:123 start_codon:yes stop_codon:yes gene_type:complete
MTTPWANAAVAAEDAVKASQATRDRLSEALDELRRDVQSL